MARATNINDDLKGLSRKMSGIVSALRGPILAAAAMDMGLVVQRGVQQVITDESFVDTGDFRASVRTEAGEVTAKSADVEVGSSKAQVFAAEYGSGLHAEKGPKEKYPIEPDEKKALFWPGAAHPVKRVMHPGIEGIAPFRRGYANSKVKGVKAAKFRLSTEISKVVRR